MNRRKVVLILALILVSAIAVCSSAWIILPDPVGLIPLQIRVRLPEDVLAMISTPIPTALPAPLRSPSELQAAIVVPDLPTASATPSPTLSLSSGSETVLSAAATNPAEIKPAATVTQTPTPVHSPTPTVVPFAYVDGLEVIAQEFNNCGPANLTMVLNYYQEQVNQTYIGDALKPDYEDRNVSPNELVSFVAEHTELDAAYYSGGDIDILKRLIAAGYPIIVEKGFMPSENLGWMGHYLTLFGFDDTEDVFMAMDSYLGPWDDSGRPESYESIMDLWEHFNNTFIVVYRVEDEAEVISILGNDFATPESMWSRAITWAQNRIEQESENAFAWFNLGTSLTELGESTGNQEFFQNAALAYDRARELGLPWRMLWYQFKPYTAYLEAGRVDEVLVLTLSAQGIEETHLYRGHALLATGDPNGAAYAYRKALQINPNFSAAAEALAALTP